MRQTNLAVSLGEFRPEVMGVASAVIVHRHQAGAIAVTMPTGVGIPAPIGYQVRRVAEAVTQDVQKLMASGIAGWSPVEDVTT